LSVIRRPSINGEIKISKGKCVEKLPHSCGSRRGLQVFQKEDGSYDGFCFSCGTAVTDPYKDKPEGYKPAYNPKTDEEIQEEIDEVKEFQTVALKDRGLSKESLEHFGIKIGLSEVDGVTPTSHFYPYYKGDELKGFKCRVIEGKKFFSIGSVKDVDLFGWHQAVLSGGKKLFVTEGEMDAVALYQIFRAVNKGTKYESNIPAIVSLAHGSGSAVKELLKHREMIFMHFKEIVLVFDQDKPGEEAVEAVLKVFPEGVSVAHLPRKDANQCLLEGVSKAAYNAVAFNSVKPKNTRLVLADSLFEEAKIAPTIGAPWPWEAVTKKTRGIRLGETVYIGAAQKMGKSEIVNTLAAHFIKELGWPVLLAKPEESNKKSVKLVAGKIVGKIFHDPNVPFDEKSYDEACDLMRNKLFLINLYQHLGWETLKADIRAAAMEGCKAIFIDPITNLTNGMSAADANTRLQEIAQELSAMALDLNVVIFIFCHLRNPDAGPPHERGGEVLSSQFAGSRAMARSCNLMFGLEGNRDPHLNPEERNIRTLVLLEDREFGEVGRFKLYWDRVTSLFNEIGEE
jgi:twinkle protein